MVLIVLKWQNIFDPEYDKLLQEAIQEGVEVYAYAGKFDFSDKKPTALSLTHCVPYIGKK